MAKGIVTRYLSDEMKNGTWEYEVAESLNDLCGIPIKILRASRIFTRDGRLFGLKDNEGNVVCEPFCTVIQRGNMRMMFIDQNRDYFSIYGGSERMGAWRSDYIPSMEMTKSRAYVCLSKDGERVSPCVYDYLEPCLDPNEIFYAEDNGRPMYINTQGEEILTRVRHLKGDREGEQVFWGRTNEPDNFTTFEYKGKAIKNNKNVVRIFGNWVEVDRCTMDELHGMLSEEGDDLRLTQKDMAMLDDSFSYEYAVHFALGHGRSPLKECLQQFEAMDVFNNSWYVLVKIWQAPGEHVKVQDLRRLSEGMCICHNIIDSPRFGVGYDSRLKPGEVRAMIVTFYNEWCFPSDFYFDWQELCRGGKLPEMEAALPQLKTNIQEKLSEECRKSVKEDLLKSVFGNIEYVKGVAWSESERILEVFRGEGCPYEEQVEAYLLQARYAGHSRKKKARDFYLSVAKWMLQHGGNPNTIYEGKAPADTICKLREMFPKDPLVKEVEQLLMQAGARTARVQLDEWEKNKDYERELEYMRSNF